MRSVILLLALSLSSVANAAVQPKWIRISAVDHERKHIEVCSYDLSKCSQLGRKHTYTVSELRNRQKQIKKIRNRTLAVKYAYAMLAVVVNPALMMTTTSFGGTQYRSYVVALQYMKALEDAAETESLGSAQILVESEAALNVIRAALDPK